MVDPSKAIIIVPTYNEVENIERLVEGIFAHQRDINILIVDDNSPDGTGKTVKKIQKKYLSLHLLERKEKLGLGTAYIAGFKWALNNGYHWIFEMDADFSHDPKEIPIFLSNMESYDLVIGSRYIKGVNVINWPLKRLLLSYFANMYTQKITGIPVKDNTGGYKCMSKNVLEAIDLDKIKTNGYGFQIEINFRAWRKGFRIKEIPIIFVDRVYGESKLSTRIMWEAIFLVWKLRLERMFGKY
jgi:dolichol-phosphate mannosyltransferase